MRKVFLAVMAAFVILICSAGIVSAQTQNVDIGINNRNDINVDTKGGDADQKQKQDQRQKQAQAQKQLQWTDQKTTVSGVEGNQTVTTPLQAPMIAPIVGPGGAQVGVEFQLGCEIFTIDELESMSRSGSFSDTRGSIFDAMMATKVKPVVRSRKATASRNSITVLDRVPTTSKILGTFTCTGDYGWSRDEALSKCLLVARRETNTSNVVVYQTNDIDAANSGTAVGAGTAMSNPFGNGSVGAGSVAASFGKTHSFKERVVLLTVVAYDDVSQACGGQPTVAPAPKACNPDDFDIQLRQYENEIIWCKWPCENNAKLRFGKANTKMDKYFCKLKNGVKDDQLLRDAIHEYGIAERDIINGRELAPGQKFGEKPKGAATKTLASAQELLYEVHYNWALSVRELRDVPSEIRHAQNYQLGQRGDGTMPETQEDMKR